MKKIILDMSTCYILANASKFAELINAYSNENYKIQIIKKNWSKEKFKGLNIDIKTKKFSKPDGNFLWDPRTHPDDYLNNLVFSSFKNLEFLKELSLMRKAILFFHPMYITYNLCLNFLSDEKEKERTQKYYLNFLLKNFSFINVIQYLIKFFEINILVLIKSKPKKFSSFRYLLAKKKMDKNVIDILKKYKNSKKKILLSVLWDENKKFEILDDRLKGGPIFKDNHEKTFKELKKFISNIDNRILKGENYQFILASKKAVDWERFIQSDYIDFRDFERLNLSLSQMIFICQELSDYSINWPSTFSIWISNCSNIKHITFHDLKDTANWCHDNLNKENIKALENNDTYIS